MSGVIAYSLLTGDTAPMALGGAVLFLMFAGTCLYLAVDATIKFFKQKFGK